MDELEEPVIITIEAPTANAGAKAIQPEKGK